MVDNEQEELMMAVFGLLLTKIPVEKEKSMEKGCGDGVNMACMC